MKKLLLIFIFLLWLPLAHANDAELKRAGEAYLIGDYQTAFLILKALAEQGHAGAQYNIGNMYSKGEGTSQNYSEAFKWFSKSAEQGIANAQFNLAVIYYKGQGISKNYDEAFKWYHKAAEQGIAEAQYNIALMYYHGEGTLENYVKSYMWAKIAIVNGHGKAKNAIQATEQEMDSTSIIELQKLVMQCLESNYQNCDDDNVLNKKTESDGIFTKIFKIISIYIKSLFIIDISVAIISLVVAGLIVAFKFFRKK